MKHPAKEYRIFLDVNTGRPEVGPIQDSWLKILHSNPDFSSQIRFYEGRNRIFLEAQIGDCRLGVTEHEWGLEYLLSFAAGVASGVVGSFIYDLLKSHFQRTSNELSRNECETLVRIDIELDTPNGSVTLGTINNGRLIVAVTLEEIVELTQENDEESGYSSE